MANLADPTNADDSAVDPVTDPPAGDPPATDPPAGDPPATDPVVPETYADFTMPEGLEVDAQLLEKAVPVFKELKLTQEQAQKLVDLEAERVQSMVQEQQDAIAQQIESWDAAAKADKEFGGDKFDENLGIAKLALEKLGTPELKQFLVDSGAGSHPEVIRAFVRMGRLMKEDNPGAGAPPAEKKDIVDIMYPKKG